MCPNVGEAGLGLEASVIHYIHEIKEISYPKTAARSNQGMMTTIKLIRFDGNGIKMT